MAQIELLQIGCTMQQIIDTINALVAAYNDGQGQTGISYEDIEDIPTINGIALRGDLTTQLLEIRTAETIDWNQISEALATKTFANGIKNEAISEAQAAATAIADNKLDKDFSNVESAVHVGDDAYVLMVVGNKVVKVKNSAMAAYVDIRSKEDSRALEAALKTQRKVINIQPRSENDDSIYVTKTPFVLGTSALFVNAERLYNGVDYSEIDSYTIAILTHIPEAGDKLVFQAVPLT